MLVMRAGVGGQGQGRDRQEGCRISPLCLFSELKCNFHAIKLMSPGGGGREGGVTLQWTQKPPRPCLGVSAQNPKLHASSMSCMASPWVGSPMSDVWKRKSIVSPHPAAACSLRGLWGTRPVCG